ncbi:-glutamine gamma-glutamyltransferase E-like [Pelobates cultripes]|uniref:-glutamine gamma-glutamyltransferase E-like n=2 Tax=Pelobates cultripes TaxID=61616 RepID=A0AAD1SM20_PELCU|nr:-glutamine gamma-glutamyltransferase E-like [Pelobates cultripes]
MSAMMTQSCLPLSHETQIYGKIKTVGTLAVGKDVNVVLSVTNPTDIPKDLNIKIRACSIIYTRKEIHELLNECKKLHVKPKEEKEMPVTITYSQYDGLLTADNMIEVTAICSSEKTNETVLIQTDIVLKNPTIEIKVLGKAYVNKPVTAEIVFTNPLDLEVSDMVVNAEGSGLLKDPLTKRASAVKAKDTITIPIAITPYKTGKKHLLVDLNSDKFKNMKGYVEIDVQEAE